MSEIERAQCIPLELCVRVDCGVRALTVLSGALCMPNFQSHFVSVLCAGNIAISVFDLLLDDLGGLFPVPSMVCNKSVVELHVALSKMNMAALCNLPSLNEPENHIGIMCIRVVYQQYAAASWIGNAARTRGPAFLFLSVPPFRFSSL